MSEHILKYYAPAENFNEAVPLGNGFLGAMIYGGYPTERISLNRDDLWSGKPYRYVKNGAYEAYVKARRALLANDRDTAESLLQNDFVCPYGTYFMPMGELALEYGETDPAGYYRQLDIYSGIASIVCASRTVEHLISYSHRCMVNRITSKKPLTVTAKLSSLLRGESRSEGNALLFEGQCPVAIFLGEITEYGDEGTRFAMALRAVTDGRVTVKDDAIVVEGATDVAFYLTAQSSLLNHTDNTDDTYVRRALDELDAAVAVGYDAIRKEHVDYYGEHMTKTELDLGGKAISDDTLVRMKAQKKGADMAELIFNYGKYLTIATSAPGSHPSNIQGLWNEKLFAEWRCDYHLNINTQMNYWPTTTCGLAPFLLPLVNQVKVIAETGRTTARAFYNADGFVCHYTSDIWGMTGPAGGEGEEHNPYNAVYTYWCGGSGWLCRPVFEYYEYTLDEDYLRNTAYPLMKEAAKFYLDVLTPMDNGMLAVFPSTSPENYFMDENGVRRAIAWWSTMTQSIVKDLLLNCVKACKILDVDEEWRAEIEAVIPKLRPFAIASDGSLLEWDREYTERDPRHRHVSHLYGLYPADLITTDRTPELAQACKRTLEKRGDDGTGWALAWKSCLWAKLKEGDHAWKLIMTQLRYKESTDVDIGSMDKGGGTYPNLFDAHPPFQIDGNFGVVAAIAMLLLQCEDDELKLLPALPKDLDHGSVKGLVAKGNVRLDMTWKDYKPTVITLTSPVAQTVRVRFDGKVKEISLAANEETAVRF